MDYTKRTTALRDILERKLPNMLYRLDADDLLELDFEIGQLYKDGDGHEYPVKR